MLLAVGILALINGALIVYLVPSRWWGGALLGLAGRAYCGGTVGQAPLPNTRLELAPPVVVELHL